MSERDDALEEAARLIESDGVNITSPQLLRLLASQARGIRILKRAPGEPAIDPMTDWRKEIAECDPIYDQDPLGPDLCKFCDAYNPGHGRLDRHKPHCLWRRAMEAGTPPTENEIASTPRGIL